MLEYFTLVLTIYIVTVTFLIFPTCCKKKEKKKRGRRGGRKTKSKISRPQPVPVLTQNNTPTATTPVVANTPIETPQTPQNEPSAESKEPMRSDNKEKPLPKDDEDDVELTRCRDYTPQIFGDLQHLFDLLS
ncbi:unnamed protein product [Caenorhabditis angaria]|uniref:Uncharacterized protein n=1 Tax=Caenorhabditis angaria TaxID=860376 RepID=A0A9P1IR58_9PELO|nr:unnamed protein product [Caenorhabditis angaria]